MKKTITVDRGQMSVRSIVLIVIGLAVGGLVASFIVPIALDELASDTDTTNVVQSNQTTESLTTSLDATVDDVQASPSDTVEITFDDSATGASTSINASNQSTTAATIRGASIDVTVNDVTGTTSADLTYEVPTDYGWSSGASNLWFVLDVVVVLVIFLIFIFLALGRSNRI